MAKIWTYPKSFIAHPKRRRVSPSAPLKDNATRAESNKNPDQSKLKECVNVAPLRQQFATADMTYLK